MSALDEISSIASMLFIVGNGRTVAPVGAGAGDIGFRRIVDRGKKRDNRA